MNNNVKSPYFNMYKYWLHSWDFWPAYPAETRYFATSEIKLIFMFWNIQMKMALQNKMIFETECHHWKLLLGSSWCACVHTHITFTHTHTHTFMTVHHTWHYSLYTLSSVQYSRRNNVSNSARRYENGEAPAKLFETECHHWKPLLDSSWCACMHTHIHVCTSHLALLNLHFVQCPIFQKKQCFKFCLQVWEWRGTC